MMTQVPECKLNFRLHVPGFTTGFLQVRYETQLSSTRFNRIKT